MKRDIKIAKRNLEMALLDFKRGILKLEEYLEITRAWNMHVEKLELRSGKF